MSFTKAEKMALEQQREALDAERARRGIKPRRQAQAPTVKAEVVVEPTRGLTRWEKFKVMLGHKV